MSVVERSVVRHCLACEVEWAASEARCWSCGLAGEDGRLPGLARIAAHEVGWWAPARGIVEQHRRRSTARRRPVSRA
jgi:hypothetical protein